MMRVLLLIFIAFGLFGAASSTANAATKRPSTNCFTTIKQNIQQIEAQVSRKAAEPSLDPAVQRWLSLRSQQIEKRAQDTGRRMTLNVGDTFKANGETVRVIAPLGDGTEAEVYLVDTAHGRRSAKIFYDEREMADNVKMVNRYSSLVAMPKIERVDHETSTVLMEYIEGIPVKEIRLHSAEIGMSKKDASEILRRFNKEKKAMIPPGQAAPPEDFNVVYSFKTRRFYLIDPF